MQTIHGVIRAISLSKRIFTVLVGRKIMYFYLTRSQQKKFSDYLQLGLFVSFNCSQNAKVQHRHKVYEVYNFIKLFKRAGRKTTVLFDISTVKKGVNKLINKEQYRLFLDLEFTMPPYDYQHGSGFVAEIIQYGAYLEDPDGRVVLTRNANVKPTSQYGLNTRTFTFLNMEMKDFKNAESPYEFYRKMNDIMMMYQPVVYVWGKNDILMLNKFYEKYKLKPLVERQKIINLMQVIKNYYNIKVDIGLFNAYHLFGRAPMEEQDHNSLHDAVATAEVFKLFQKEISSK